MSRRSYQKNLVKQQVADAFGNATTPSTSKPAPVVVATVPTFNLDELLNSDFNAEYEAAQAALAEQGKLREQLMDCALMEYMEGGRYKAIVAQLNARRWGELSAKDIMAQLQTWQPHEKTIMAPAIKWAGAIYEAIKAQEALANQHTDAGLMLFTKATSTDLLDASAIPAWYTPLATDIVMESITVTTVIEEKPKRTRKPKAQPVEETVDITAQAKAALEKEFGSNGIWMLSQQDIVEIVGASTLSPDYQVAILASF
jgi:hypothetical protein